MRKRVIPSLVAVGLAVIACSEEPLTPLEEGPVAVNSPPAASQAQDLTPIEELGKELFFDKISQPAKAQSCASCHLPAAGWTGGIAGLNLHGAVYRGAAPQRFGNRKPPSTWLWAL